MNIQKVKITNYKCFKDTFEIILNPSINIIVGNNEEGKSTILEAINMALTGLYRGQYIKNELSEDFFNIDCVHEYIKAIKEGNSEKAEPPKITIEIFTLGIPDFQGSSNSENDNDAEGFIFEINFDETFKEEYQEFLTNEIQSLPIEYYEYKWRTFSRNIITPKKIPIKSVTIDSSNNYNKNVDIYLSKMVSNLLNKEEQVKVSQARRQANDAFNSTEIVKNLNSIVNEDRNISEKDITFSLNGIAQNSWVSSLITYLNNISFQNIGMGEQCALKTRLALANKKSQKANIVFIEEPENHLSFSKLNRLINDIENQCEEKQIIINTHSSFVANKLGLNNLTFLNNKKNIKLSSLKNDTFDYFKKISGYDTLRLILCKKAILVEGDSDELVVQKAYQQKHGKLPIEDEIDVISVGTAFLRYLEIANEINKAVIVITDNDGNIEQLNKKYSDYLEANKKENIEISFDKIIDVGELEISNKKYNYNTLEPKILKANSKEILEEILHKTFTTEDDLRKFMFENKTECAIKIFETTEDIKFPDYIYSVI
jgi:putative ATP-dependent endonuclease of OLD family